MSAARIAALDAKILAIEAKHGLTWCPLGLVHHQVWTKIEAEVFAEVRQHEFLERRRRYWNALRHLWTAPEMSEKSQDHGMGDVLEDASGLRRLGYRLGCTLAMLFGRKGMVGWRGQLDMAFWDVRSDAYGWSSLQLFFQPSRLRFSIESDGDSFM